MVYTRKRKQHKRRIRGTLQGGREKLTDSEKRQLGQLFSSQNSSPWTIENDEKAYDEKAYDELNKAIAGISPKYTKTTSTSSPPSASPEINSAEIEELAVARPPLPVHTPVSRHKKKSRNNKNKKSRNKRNKISRNKRPPWRPAGPVRYPY